MQAFLVKPAAMLMAMVMAMTAIVCRCGMASCVTDLYAQAVARSEPKQPCERGCAKHESAPGEEQAPSECDDCGKDKLVLDRPAPGAESVVDLQLFAPAAADLLPVIAPISVRRSIGAEVRTAPPIDVLRQSCALLI